MVTKVYHLSKGQRTVVKKRDRNAWEITATGPPLGAQNQKRLAVQMKET